MSVVKKYICNMKNTGLKHFLLLPFLVLSLNSFAQFWELKWAKSGVDLATTVCVDPTGGYLIGGNSGDNTSFILHVDSLGVVDWEKEYSSSAGDVQIQEVIPARDSGFYVCTTNNLWGTESDLLKITSDGSIAWKKHVNFALNGIYENSNNELFAASTFYLSKWDLGLQDTLWTKRFDSDPVFPIFKDIIELQDGNFLAYGAHGSNWPSYSKAMVKFNSAGDTIWTVYEGRFTQPEDLTGRIEDAIELTDGSILTCDNLGDIFKFDSMGSVLWSYDYSDPHPVSWKRIFQVADGTYCLGSISTFLSHGTISSFFVIMKINDIGEILWVSIKGANSYDDVMEDAVFNEETGEFVLVGSSFSPFTGQKDVFAFVVDSLGYSECGVFDDSLSSSTALPFWNEIYSSLPPSNFTITPSTVNSSSSANQNTLLCSPILNVEDFNTEFRILVYPNPTGEFINIRTESEDEFDLQLIDISGSVINSLRNQKGNVQLDVSKLSSGIYLVKIGNTTGVSQEKIVVSR